MRQSSNVSKCIKQQAHQGRHHALQPINKILCQKSNTAGEFHHAIITVIHLPQHRMTVLA
jgi:hypothetical protein